MPIENENWRSIAASIFCILAPRQAGLDFGLKKKLWRQSRFKPSGLVVKLSAGIRKFSNVFDLLM
jgi:hypothetical protein